MSPKKNKKGGGGGGGDSAPSTPRSEAAESARAEPIDDSAADDEETEEEQTGSKRDGADISKVTDFVEGKELDSAKASQAIASITSDLKVDREAEAARERELAAVSIEQVRARELRVANRTISLPPHPISRSHRRLCTTRARDRSAFVRRAPTSPGGRRSHCL